uniref:Uncharacterized protein n=1 Tax=Timema poppense TaxID=170557 RepID=A0A7R9HGG4_TIMPO|nr:unnamed protein product [Timema poppensis]
MHERATASDCQGGSAYCHLREGGHGDAEFRFQDAGGTAYSRLLTGYLDRDPHATFIVPHRSTEGMQRGLSQEPRQIGHRRIKQQHIIG